MHGYTTCIMYVNTTYITQPSFCMIYSVYIYTQTKAVKREMFLQNILACISLNLIRNVCPKGKNRVTSIFDSFKSL